MQIQRNRKRANGTSLRRQNKDGLKRLRRASRSELQHLYRDLGFTQYDIAKKFGVSYTAVFNQCIRKKVERRTLIEAGKLRYRKIWFKLSKVQEQLIYGSLLGDACLHRFETRTRAGNRMVQYRLVFAQGEDQLQYLKHKADLLPCSKLNQRPKGSNLGRPIFQSVFSNTAVLEPIAKMCHRKHKKHITKEWLKKLNWRGIAYWYQDDGSLIKMNKSGWRILFSTQGFSCEEAKNLCVRLKDFGLTAHINTKLGKYGNVQPIIHCMHTREVIRFANKIKKFITPCLHYKIRCLPSYAEEKTPHSRRRN